MTSKATAKNKILAVECMKATQSIAHVAAHLKVTRQTIYNWMDDDEQFKKEMDDAKEWGKDYVENSIFQKATGITWDDQAGEMKVDPEKADNTLLMFFAKCKMKDRGYVERQENWNFDGQTIKVKTPQIDYGELEES